MANLTIAVDDDLLHQARMRALAQGTSVNALLRDYLIAYADPDRSRKALAGFLESARSSSAGSGPGGRKWTRDELHQR